MRISDWSSDVCSSDLVLKSLQITRRSDWPAIHLRHDIAGLEPGILKARPFGREHQPRHLAILHSGGETDVSAQALRRGIVASRCRYHFRRSEPFALRWRGISFPRRGIGRVTDYLLPRPPPLDRHMVKGHRLQHTAGDRKSDGQGKG